MKAIVHIGAPKTGTSTIQDFLFRNAAGLAAQGFRFHRNVPGRGSQYEYPLAALASINRLLPGVEEQTRYSSTDLAVHKATGATVVAELAANRAGWTEPMVLFSSEHIFPWLKSAEDMRALDRLFAAQFDAVHYILYIRNQHDLIVSEYSEMLKRGSNLRMPKFVESRKASLDYEPRVRRWIEAVGRDRFDLRLTDQNVLADGDLLADYAQACGFALHGLERPPRVNESLSAPAAECLRMLNERVPQLTHEGQHNPLRKGFVEQLMAMTPPNAPKLALPPDLAAEVDEVVGEGNERLRALFFPDRAALFAPAAERGRPPREAILEQAMDLAGRMVIRLRLGRMAMLTPEQQAVSVQRQPGGVSNGIAAPPPQPAAPQSDTHLPASDHREPYGDTHGNPRQ